MLLKVYRLRPKIDLNPDYQRGKVWSKEKQQLLMDSILRGMDVPAIYLRVLNDGYYECVDGQQRLSSIFDFFDNNLKLSKKYSSEYGNLTFDELSQEIKDIFEDYELMVTELDKSSDEEIREMFDRLQRGMALTSGERLNAKMGNLHNFISELSEYEFLVNDINVRNYRHAYHQMCAQMVALEFNGISDVKFKILEQMYEDNKAFDLESKKAQHIKRVLNFLARTFDTKTPELHSRATVVSLYLLISKLIKEYSLKNKEDVLRKFIIEFEKKLNEAEEKDDVELLKYLQAISHSSDSTNSIKTRHETLRIHFLLFAKDLEPLDVNRDFSLAQRIAIYRKDKETCKECGKKVEWEEFHADHIKPYARGGKSVVDNGQVLCEKCNLSKGAKE